MGVRYLGLFWSPTAGATEEQQAQTVWGCVACAPEISGGGSKLWCVRERETVEEGITRGKKKESHLVEFKELPEDNAQLLGEEYLLDRVRKVSLWGGGPSHFEVT